MLYKIRNILRMPVKIIKLAYPFLIFQIFVIVADLMCYSHLLTKISYLFVSVLLLIDWLNNIIIEFVKKLREIE